MALHVQNVIQDCKIASNVINGSYTRWSALLDFASLSICKLSAYFASQPLLSLCIDVTHECTEVGMQCDAG